MKDFIHMLCTNSYILKYAAQKSFKKQFLDAFKIADLRQSLDSWKMLMLKAWIDLHAMKEVLFQWTPYIYILRYTDNYWFLHLCQGVHKAALWGLFSGQRCNFKYLALASDYLGTKILQKLLQESLNDDLKSGFSYI